ncbi:MAG TPA: MFS transporter [Candidatus Acidoferrales bacterium]|nr:MFS transporter [Candidatus Acidoferrales bacterium]
MVTREQINAKWNELRETGSLLWLITLGHTFTHWCPATFYLLLPFLVEELGLTYSQAGLLITVRSATSVLMNIPAGMAVDMIGRRGLLMAAALLWTGVPYLLVGLSGSYFWIAFFMGFVSMGNYLWHPAAMSTLSEKYPDRRGFAIAIHALGPNIGEGIAPFLVGVLLMYLSWRNVLFVNLIPGIVIVIILWKYLFSTSAMQVSAKEGLSLGQYWEGIKAMGQNVALLGLVFIAGMRSMTQQGLHTFLPLYLTRELGLSSALVGLYISVAQSAGMISTPLAGGISDRRGRKKVLTTGLISASAALIALAYFQFHALFIAVLALIGFFLYAIRPVIWAWVLDIGPKNLGGTTISAFSGAQAIFSSLSPVICGFIADRWGILTAFYFLAGTILLANIVVLAIPEEKREADAIVTQAVEAK